MTCRTCQNCASNGNNEFCAAGSPCFPYGEGCSDWSPRKDVTIKGIMPDGKCKEVTPEQLYAAYEVTPWPVKLARYYTVLTVLLAAIVVAAGVVHVSCTILPECEVEEVNK